MSRICLITGVMASGKSSVAQRVAGSLPRAVHLCGDVFRRMIVSGRMDMSENAPPEALEQLRLRYRLTADAARAYHAAGFDVIAQDNYYGEMLPYMLNLLDGLPVLTVVLCPSIEAIAARERARDKKGYGGFAIAPLYDSFLRETPRIGLWIDSTHQTVDETARAVLRAMENHFR